MDLNLGSPKQHEHILPTPSLTHGKSISNPNSVMICPTPSPQPYPNVPQLKLPPLVSNLVIPGQTFHH